MKIDTEDWDFEVISQLTKYVDIKNDCFCCTGSVISNMDVDSYNIIDIVVHLAMFW